MSKIKIQRLDWDSQFFGYEIGSIKLVKGEVDFKFDNKYDLIYIFSEDVLPSKHYPKYIDKKVIYKKKITNKQLSDLDAQIYKGEINQALINLSIQSGAFSRFKLDKKLSSNFEELYTEWIRNSIEGSLADYIIVLKHDNKIIGFTTITQKDTFFQIGLISISEKYRGKGLGAALLNKVEEIVKVDNVIHVATQYDNRVACKFYEKHGYSIYSTNYIYHIWR